MEKVKEDVRKIMEKWQSEQMKSLKNDVYNDISEKIEIPVKVVAIAKANGFKVLKEDLPYDNVDALITVDNLIKSEYKSAKVIRVNIGLKDFKKRFTIAKALGIYSMYADIKPFYHFLPSVESNITAENKYSEEFAVELLMPDEPFMKQFKECKERELSENEMLRQLSSSFAVPKFAVKMKIKIIQEKTVIK